MQEKVRKWWGLRILEAGHCLDLYPEILRETAPAVALVGTANSAQASSPKTSLIQLKNLLVVPEQGPYHRLGRHHSTIAV